MSKQYAILPCNGLDKCAGCVTREVALLLSEQSESKIICPVFYRTVDKYNKQAKELPLLVIDGCATIRIIGIISHVAELRERIEQASPS